MKAIIMKQPVLAGIEPIRLPNIVKNMMKMLETWKSRAEQRRQLASLDDRMLQDIGITRADVYREYSKKVWEA